MSYQDLLVYRLATTIYDGTVEFCRRFIRSPRQKEQMEQAARSGKHPEVERSSLQGSPAPSFASGARAKYC